MSKHSSNSINEEGLILSGYQKKLKTMKKKFFVLYKDTLRNAARLEYYDNDRKFKAGLPPKRVIKLKHCFNINRRLDTKYEFVIGLSTKDSSFGIVFETEHVMLQWLEHLISLQRDKSTTSEPMQPHFEHVWQVIVQRKGLAESKGIVGNYHVCLTPKSLTFIVIGSEKVTTGDTRMSKIEFLLTTIRRCGDSQCFFYMEVGRQSVVGPGELWMETEDSLIAQNMHRMILSAMSAKSDTNMEPMRKRSSSANEASKPINVIQRRQTQTDIKGNSSPQTSICFGRERCDSLPSRNRTSSECSNQSFTIPSTLTMRNNSVHRSQSYQRHSNSPPMNSVMGCSESEESSISIDEPDENGTYVPFRYISRSEGVIPEENTEELISSENKSSDNLSQIENETLEENYISMAPLRNYKELDEHNNTNQFIKSSRDDIKCVPLNCSPYDHSAKLEFAEYTSDNVSKIFTNDLNIQNESLPTRTYSIGSKFEHNKLNKRIGNLNDSEHSTMRVRAFSVGSRAKIPRCDLQRGMLYPNVVIKEQNFNSNNNINVATDAANYNTLLNMDATNRDKKSTSAPLLIHKSQNSVDRMSDLMEIDFSKSTTTTPTNNSNNQHRTYQQQQQQQMPTKMPYGKSATNLPISVNYDFNRSNRFDTTAAGTTITSTTNTNTSSGSITCSVRDSPTYDDSENNLAVKAQTDNGYLEMKPVGSGGGGGGSSGSSSSSGGGSSGGGLFTKNLTNINSLNRYYGNHTNTKTLQSTTSEHSMYIPKIADSNAIRRNKIVLQMQQIQQQQEQVEIKPQSLASLLANKFEALQTKNILPEKYINDESNKDDTTEKSISQVETTQNISNRGIETTNHRNNKINSLNAINLSSKFAQMNLNVNDNRENKTNIANTDDNRKADENILTNYTTICKNNSVSQRKQLKHDNVGMNSTNDEGGGNLNTNLNANANSILDRESGYEILEIKSDSSLLQGNKNSNRPSSIRKQQQQQQQTGYQPQQSHLQLSQQNQMKIKSQQPLAMSSNITTSNNCNNTTILTSQSMANSNPNNLGGTSRNISNFKIQSFNSTSAAAITTPPTTAAVAAVTTSLSRPPSVSSEHGLYYASLDLPQSSGEITSKSPKGGDALNESSPINIPDVNNSYAKIDFDHHSDSSSSSSKNMNI